MVAVTMLSSVFGVTGSSRWNFPIIGVCIALLSAMFIALWLKGLKLHACLSQVPPARLVPPAPQVTPQSCCRLLMSMGPNESMVSNILQPSSD